MQIGESVVYVDFSCVDCTKTPPGRHKKNYWGALKIAGKPAGTVTRTHMLSTFFNQYTFIKAA
jgi:hypothetical protein